jgi:Bcr/CflA subfamily drug resistance transporter
MQIVLKRRITILSIIAPFLAGIGVDLYVPSLPYIKSYFHTSNRLTQLTIGTYMLGYALGHLVLIPFSDRFGRKKILALGCLLFTIVSFLAALASNIYMLNLYRFLQGIAIGSIGVTLRAVPVDCFHEKDLIKTINYLSISWALGPIIGPYIGAHLQNYFGWQGNFYFYSFYSLLVLIFVVFFIVETHTNTKSISFIQTTSNIKQLLLHPVFVLSSLLLALIYSIFILFNIVGPFLIQNQLHYSVIVYGHIALVLGFGYFIGNLLNRVVINFIDSFVVVMTALISAFVIAITMLLLVILEPPNLWNIIPPLFFLFCCCGFVFSNVMAKAIGLYPQKAGMLSSMFGAMVTGGVFVITYLASFFKNSSQLSIIICYVLLLSSCLFLFIFIKKYDERIIQLDISAAYE